MKILVLHGFGQTSHIIKQRAKYLFNNIEKNGHHLIFLDGLIDVQLFDQDGNVRQEGKAWFAYNENDPNIFLDEMKKDQTKWYGIENTYKQIIDIECDAIIGFSQGAAVALALAHLIKPDKLILFSGFIKPKPTNWSMDKYNGQTLMIYDPEDTIIEHESLLTVKEWCTDVEDIIHSKGHSVPTTSSIRTKIKHFLDA